MSDTVLIKLFQVFQNKLEFDPADYLVASGEQELNKYQKDLIEKASEIIKENIVGDIKSFGGNVKVNDEKFKELEERANEELENEEYGDIKKELKNYVKLLKELIEKTCVAIIPVKEMPWADVLFRSVPRIVFDKKVALIDDAIAYYGEIKCVISRATIFGKMQNEKPLFAPITGSVDLGGYILDESQKGSKAQIYSYVSAIIGSLDSTMTRNHLAKYHEAYQRHGDPISDFLMKDEELMNSMEKITSSIESNRTSSEIAVFSIAIPQPTDKTTILLTIDEGKEPDQFTKCFEALLRFSAECCNAPSVSTAPQQTQASGQAVSQQAGGVRTPGGQELKVWTADELASEAQKRMESQPNMAEWTEDELNKFAEERGSGLPEGMELWTEEGLQELARKRQGGLDIPEWEPDKDMKECVKCGYSLRPGWSKCPICETPVGTEVEPDKTEPEQSEESNDHPSEKKEEIPSEKPEEKEEDQA
ncbi:MAG: zinc ribbon domain-containing protein [Promethearchaeota archaeon]